MRYKVFFPEPVSLEVALRKYKVRGKETIFPFWSSPDLVRRLAKIFYITKEYTEQFPKVVGLEFELKER